jgi:uncharacterized SAM-binding protein YcdF (DUF218 family)
VLLFIVLSLVAGLLCAFTGRRTSAAGLSALSLLLLLAASTPFLPRALLNYLQAPYRDDTMPTDWGTRPAIVLLGQGTERIPGSPDLDVGGFSHSRLLKTFELYSACRKTSASCTVIISGGDPQNHGKSEAEVYADSLVEDLDMSREDIVLETASRNTFENAKYSAQILKAKGHDHVILVSSGLHLRRALQYFAHFGISATPLRSDYLSVPDELLPNELDMMFTAQALHEFRGLLLYRVYEAFGWN